MKVFFTQIICVVILLLFERFHMSVYGLYVDVLGSLSHTNLHLEGTAVKIIIPFVKMLESKPLYI